MNIFILFQRALWSDMFTGRLKTEIPQALVSKSKHLVLHFFRSKISLNRIERQQPNQRAENSTRLSMDLQLVRKSTP